MDKKRSFSLAYRHVYLRALPKKRAVTKLDFVMALTVGVGIEFVVLLSSTILF